MKLMDDEIRFVKELYIQKIKQLEIELLDEAMWIEVEAAKPDWKKVVKIKRAYRELKGAVSDAEKKTT